MPTQNILCNIILYHKLQNFFWSIKLLGGKREKLHFWKIQM